MDWIRRNWPDLLIGIALVAVIAGIIATLLTGGSFFPFGQPESSSSRQQTSSSSPTSLAGAAEAGSARSGRQTSESSSGSSTREADGGIGGVEVTALPLPGASRSGAQNDAAASAAGAQPSEARSGDASNSVASNSVAPTDSASSTSTTQPVAETRTAPAPATGTSSPASARDDDGLYRVSVGAFTSSDNAERQADIFREAGYPVFIGTQGNLSIVLVGPYDQRSEAERAAEKIRAGDFRIEPVIYRFRSESGATSASSSAAGSTSSNASESSSSSATTPAPQPSASEAGGARYLQVGAYATVESAQPQRDRLEGLGFRVTERTEGSLVKLLVGPFVGEDLSAARSRLNEQGIDHFPR